MFGQKLVSIKGPMKPHGSSSSLGSLLGSPMWGPGRHRSMTKSIWSPHGHNVPATLAKQGPSGLTVANSRLCGRGMKIAGPHRIGVGRVLWVYVEKT